jgi:hypothetical protein
MVLKAVVIVVRFNDAEADQLIGQRSAHLEFGTYSMTASPLLRCTT